MEKKYVNIWKEKARNTRLHSAIDNYSRQGYMGMRELIGNYPLLSNMNGPKMGSNKYYSRIARNKNILLNKMSHEIFGPLYKGIKGANAKFFREHGYFNARTPTSSSRNRFQASLFTNSINPVILYIPKRTQKGINVQSRSSRPREQEVILAPGLFIWTGNMTKNGNYIIHH